MKSIARAASLAFAVSLILGCAAPAPTRQTTSREVQAQQGPTRATAAIMSNPPLLYGAMAGGTGLGPGAGSLEELVAIGLTFVDSSGAQHPRLAESVPSVENGQWVVLPDGTMRTSWKIRPGAQWHDGTPVTVDDLLFTLAVHQDRDLTFTRHPPYDFVERVETSDPRTITVSWKQPYIEADTLFSIPPLPRHLLEKAYLDDKAGFANLPYWHSDAFIGTGPYRVQQWVKDSHVLLRAHDGYALGRPNIDEIEVKLLLDANTVIANVLAGVVEATLGQSVSLEQGLLLRDQWSGGRIETWVDSTIKVWPQFVNPNPVIVTDVRFRKALLHAIDRQEMVDTIMAGLSSVAHSKIQPNEPEYPEVQASAVRYEFDVRRAAQIIEGLGYRKDGEGFYRDAANERLTVQIHSSTSEENLKSMHAVADYWQRAGVSVEIDILPQQRRADVAYRAGFPAFSLQAGPGVGVSQLKALHSSEARLPEYGYRGRNFSRYINPALDGLLDRFATTIPRPQRIETIRQIVHHMTDQLNLMTLFYVTRLTLVNNRLVNVGADPSRNVHEWSVR